LYKQYDGVVNECRRLRNDLDKLRCDSITCKLPPHSPASCAETIRPLSPSPKCYTPFKPVVAKPSEADFGGSKLVPLLAEFEEESLLADFFQLACRTEPELLDQRGSQSDDEKFYGMFTKAMAQKPKSPVEPQFPSSSESTDSRGRSSSFSGGISRASDQATGVTPPALRAIRIPVRQRSDSLPSAPISPLGEQELGSEVAFSLPGGSVSRSRGVIAQSEPLTPSTAIEAVPEVTRLYSLLDKSKPISTPQSRNVKVLQSQDATTVPSRPSFSRSASLHQQRVVPQAKSNLSSSLPTSNNIPSSMAINVPSSYSMSPSISSPSQLPVQMHAHRFAPAGTLQGHLPPRIPAMQQETRVRRERGGSVSTASSAAHAGARDQPNPRYGVSVQTSPVQPAMVPASSLSRRPPVVAAHDFWTPQMSQLSGSLSSSG